MTSKPSFLIDIENAQVFLKGQQVLFDIRWTMKADENWAIVGNNGAGKTTFMKLVFGELIPVYGGRVRWFGSAEPLTLWDIRDKIGFVSAEYQAGYDFNISGLDVVISGFFSSIGLYDTATQEQRSTAREWMDFLGILYLENKGYWRMSYGEARRVLLARALVNRPKLLVLDEPCNGLDIPTKEKVLETIEKISRTETRLIHVTHHIDEIPRSVTHVLYLKQGRVIRQGKKEAMLSGEVLSGVFDCQIDVQENDGRYWITGCKTLS